MSSKADCRTALATPGLVKKLKKKNGTYTVGGADCGGRDCVTSPLSYHTYSTQTIGGILLSPVYLGNAVGDWKVNCPLSSPPADLRPVKVAAPHFLISTYGTLVYCTALHCSVVHSTVV